MLIVLPVGQTAGSGQNMQRHSDIFIIGGGINGVGVARDAAGRGLSVTLVEQADLAGATSSASSKLIHGGLRYLENYEFGLVRESLMERETLWKIAPHIITPLRFVLPHHKGLRPAFILRIGLFLYDYIGGRKLLPPTKRINLTNDPLGEPLSDEFKLGFEYSDCWVDDARLVVLNAASAAELGAEIHTRHSFVGAERRDGKWHINVKADSGETHSVTANMLVNAAGPWVNKTLDACKLTLKPEGSVRLVKGSHIVVPKLYDHAKAYTFQNADGRVIFAIPYQGDYTLVGTTDTPFDTDPRTAAADEGEINYLCAAASEYFKVPLKPDDVAWSYSGVRPLYDDGAKNASKATRDYVLELLAPEGMSPILSIYGGKVTTYRRLAEEVLEKLEPHAAYKKGPWTAGAPLPGGDLPGRENPAKALDGFTRDLAEKTPWLPADLCARIAASYGTRVYEMLADAGSLEDLGEHFGAGLYAREIKFLQRTEWAQTAEDILWRRTKLGLHMTEAQRARVADWLVTDAAT